MEHLKTNRNINNNIGDESSMIRRIAECKCAYSFNEESMYDMIIHENANPINNNSRGTINEN